jgi:hypothetical protein
MDQTPFHHTNWRKLAIALLFSASIVLMMLAVKLVI